MFAFALGLLALAASQEATAPPAPARAARPNVVLVLVDDLGWRDLGVTGSDYHHTPNLDRLASEGMLFEAAYCAAANCAPSRAAILSGQYGPRTGVYTVPGSGRSATAERALEPIASRAGLPPETETIAEVLGRAGYRSAAIGKWHLAGRLGKSTALLQGFDVAVGTRGGLVSYFSPYGNPSLESAEPGEYLTTRLTDEALGFVEECGDEPFFVYLSYYAVHTVRGKKEVEPRASFLEAVDEREPGEVHKNREYAAMVEGLDHEVGRLLAGLERLGQADDTLFVFTSDNGGTPELTDMSPLRGSKGMLTEGGLRVPLIVRWPGHVQPGARSSEPVIGVDFLPTFAAACGVELGEDDEVDGVDLGPVLTGSGGLGREAIFWHFPTYLSAPLDLGVGPWRASPCSVVRRGPHKLVQRFEDGSLELYDLADDPQEAHNLAKEDPATARELCALLAAWRAEIDAPVPAGSKLDCDAR